MLPLAGITVVLEAVTLSGMPVTRLLAPGAAMVVIAEFVRGGGRVRPSPPLVFATLYISWAILSGLWSDGPDGTRFLLQSLVIALIYMFAFAILLNSERDLKMFLYPVVLVAAVIAGLSVIAFGTPGAARSPTWSCSRPAGRRGRSATRTSSPPCASSSSRSGSCSRASRSGGGCGSLMVGATVTLLGGHLPLALARCLPRDDGARDHVPGHPAGAALPRAPREGGRAGPRRDRA